MTHGQGVRRFCSFAWLLLFLCVIAAPIAANAVGVNVTGTWNLTVMTNGAPELQTNSSDQVLCKWTGLMTLTQIGTDFAGSMMLNLVTGPCPATLSGPVQGSLSGGGSGFLISFGLASGEFGLVSFDGTVSDDGQSGQGTWTNVESGTWSAQKIRTAAPTLSGSGLAALFGLLLAAGALSASRRAARTSTNS
jgi:hypothetical protein